MSGRICDLTPAQAEKLRRLRVLLDETVAQEDIKIQKDFAEFEDYWILKFLRARKFVVNDAFDMILSHLRWRRTFAGGVETITFERIEKVVRGLYCYRHFDSENRVIEWVRMGLHDKNTRDLELTQMMVVYNSEFGRRYMSPTVEYKTSVFDCTNIGHKSLDIQLGKFIAQMGAENYPETMGRLVVYNAPFIFWASWAMFKPFIDPVTASKIHFCNTIQQLEEFIPRSKIPIQNQRCYIGRQ
eukprot:TRINITY_DN1749_c0_g1_i2.p1 TRINITY_DN1749_c0_g1~~TRINITY_DN1749_c0_g1_i2.p1  ORF type:complete len:242 (-),score=9.62 TRINITY_DN1749_c0_g1_i2:380-1105(-)